MAWPLYSDLYTRLTQPWRWTLLAGIGGMAVGVALLMALLRKSAYVQPFSDHIRIVTPLLRMNISHRRLLRTTTARMSQLFPRRQLHGLKRDILAPLYGNTAVVMEFNALPLPISTLKLFLSPFFFKDRTPHLVILVKDWMGFSTELDSLSTGTWEPPVVVTKSKPASILARLPIKK